MLVTPDGNAGAEVTGGSPDVSSEKTEVTSLESRGEASLGPVEVPLGSVEVSLGCVEVSACAASSGAVKSRAGGDAEVMFTAWDVAVRPGLLVAWVFVVVAVPATPLDVELASKIVELGCGSVES